MSEHDVERAKARRAVDVASNRSKKKASIKRAMTMTVKTAATTAAVAAGTYAINKYLANHNVAINGKAVRNVVDLANKARNFMRHIWQK